MILRNDNEISHCTFEHIEAAKGVHHLFTTRLGGASEGAYSSMNLSALTGDNPDVVMQNYYRIASLGFPVESMVFSKQSHGCRVRQITAEDRGKGIVRDCDYKGIDGLVTNDPSVTLVTFYADCVPLYFYDPVKRAIGLSHAGWRGTVGQIGAKTLQSMADHYDSDPVDILVGIGPSICKSCFEVGNEVAEEFAQAFDFASDFIVSCGKKPDKSYIDLQGINRQSLICAGIPAENIELSGMCTKENTDLFYSHRAMGLKRGTLAAFMRLDDAEGHRGAR
ncbi:MAG: peptidoglycan editing factor PgeF [Coriobacteriia bacterium]|nr:peptidoglycan editing factor PgeF [Coriobacteriia bacterium]